MKTLQRKKEKLNCRFTCRVYYCVYTNLKYIFDIIEINWLLWRVMDLGDKIHIFFVFFVSTIYNCIILHAETKINHVE